MDLLKYAIILIKPFWLYNWIKKIFFSFQGITVSLDKNNDLIIARILQDSLADKQGEHFLWV